MLLQPTLTEPAAVQRFLSEEEMRQDGELKLFFKVHEEYDRWLIVDASDRVRADTDQATTLYFILAHDLAKARQDEQGYQYFEIIEEMIPRASIEPQAQATLFVARHITDTSTRKD